jgi:hypothetical protein
MNRRDFLKTSGVLGAASLLPLSLTEDQSTKKGWYCENNEKFEIPELMQLEWDMVCNPGYTNCPSCHPLDKRPFKFLDEQDFLGQGNHHVPWMECRWTKEDQVPVYMCGPTGIAGPKKQIAVVLKEHFYQNVQIWPYSPDAGGFTHGQHAHAWLPHYVAKNLNLPFWGPLHVERWASQRDFCPVEDIGEWSLSHLRLCGNKDAWPIPDRWKKNDISFFETK